MSAAQAEPGSPLRLVEVTALLLVVTVAVLRGVGPFLEPDYWWQLRAGDHILNTGALTGFDASAAFSDKAYVATQWLPEAFAALAFRVFGTGGVLWLRAVSIIAMTLVVYLTARQGAARLPAAMSTGAAVLGAGASLNPRPQLVSFLLFAVVLRAWWGTAADGRPRWWLIPVFWLWACSHGLWIFGLAVGVLFTIALAIAPDADHRRGRLPRLATLNAACLAAVGSTPLGVGALLAPFQVAGNASWLADEWKATPINNPFSVVAISMIVVTAVLWTRQPERPALWQLMLLSFAAACVLWMWRLVPIGCIAAAPLLAQAATMSPVPATSNTRQDRRFTAAIGLAASFLALVICLSPLGSRAAQYPEAMPTVDRALSRLPSGSVVFSDFGLSGWLLWRHPALVPVADLRVEIYPQEHLRDYVAATEARPGWDLFIARTGSEYALVTSDSAIAGALSERLDWRALASSQDFVLLAAPDVVNQ